jgi:hypothetical protein
MPFVYMTFDRFQGERNPPAITARRQEKSTVTLHFQVSKESHSRLASSAANPRSGSNLATLGTPTFRFTSCLSLTALE